MTTLLFHLLALAMQRDHVPFTWPHVTERARPAAVTCVPFWTDDLPDGEPQYIIPVGVTEDDAIGCW